MNNYAYPLGILYDSLDMRSIFLQNKTNIERAFARKTQILRSQNIKS